MKKITSSVLLFALVAVLCLATLPTTTSASNATSTQATQNVPFSRYAQDAYDMGFVPLITRVLPDLDVSRTDFAEIVVMFYESIAGTEIEGRVTFSDTTDENIAKAAYLGIITGFGNNTVQPIHRVTREQAAVMLSRLAVAIGVILPTQAPAHVDISGVSPWALEAVEQVLAAELIIPFDDNSFGADVFLTRGEVAAAVVWLYDLHTVGSRRVTINLNSQRLTNQDLANMVNSGEVPANVTHLHLAHNQISDISPIASLSDLRVLKLQQNNIHDFRYLVGLENLTVLDISFNVLPNRVINIAPIGYLTGLEVLYTWNNAFNNTSHLDNLTNLTRLGLGRPPGLNLERDPWANTDLSFLSSMPNLTYLSLRNLGLGRLTDLSFISELAYLEELVIQGASHLTDLSFLQNLGNLTRLTLGWSVRDITDFSPISYLTRLEFLDVSQNNITDLTTFGFENLTNLTELQLWHNEITDISALSGLVSLDNLSLYNNRISDISALSGLTALTILRLHNNEIADISALSGLVLLRSLDLNRNQITDISIVSGLSTLLSLDLGNNQITAIPSLDELTSLGSLFLSNNQIAYIQPLTELRWLSSLELSHNQISDISPLGDAENLMFLELVGNNITDVYPLSNLSRLFRLDLRGNPVDADQIAELIEALPNADIQH